MNSRPTISLSAGLSSSPGFRGALAVAIRRITLRVVATTFAIVIALDAWSIFDIANETIPQIPAVEAYVSGTVVNVLMAFCLMFTTLVANEMVAGGARRLPAYACAVVAGCAVAVLAQRQVHQWLHLRSRFELPGVPHEAILMQSVAIFLEYLVWGGIIVSIYVNRRAALLASARMNTAQVERAHAQRRTLQSRLQALQARVEPQFLFNTLAQVRDLFDRDPVGGNEMLGDLIVYLRATLPLLRDSMSTLEQELRLVRAYLSIVRVRLAKPLTFDIRVAQPELAARVPPMILLPLLDRALANALSSSATDIAISVAAEISVGRLRVEINHSGSCYAAEDHEGSLCAIQDRLSAMYGKSGSLVFKTTNNYDTQAVMEIPHESTDSSPR